MNETKIYSSPAIAGTIEIHKNDITKLKTDAVVNAANSGLRAVGGVCGAIFRAAGVAQLQAACDKIGHCPTGGAVITPSFGMKNNKYIIHAVGPVYNGGNCGEKNELYSCYQESLKLAKQYGCRSIGFPLISSGIFGYPVKEAWEIALSACKDFLVAHSDYNLNIVFVNRDDDVLRIGRTMLYKITEDEANSNKLPSSERDDDFGVWLAEHQIQGKRRIRICVADAGRYQYSKYHQMVADFADLKVAEHYTEYMRGKKRCAAKDIILQEILSNRVNDEERITYGPIICVYTSSGEVLSEANWRKL